MKLGLDIDTFTGPRAFARHMLRNDRLPLTIDPNRISCWNGKVLEVILFRECCWQVALVSGFPNVLVPRHRHNRVSSVELALGGKVIADVNSKALRMTYRGSLSANFTRVPSGVWHGGAAGPEGVVFLSFQHWKSGEPDWLANDWEEYRDDAS